MSVDIPTFNVTGDSKPFTSVNKNYQCENSGGSENPDERVFHCNITERNFDRLLEHGDKWASKK